MPRARLLTDQTLGLSFTRRAVVLGAGQAATGVLLAGRMAWLGIAENVPPACAQSSAVVVSTNSSQPAAARLDRRPHRPADRDQPHELPRRHPA